MQTVQTVEKISNSKYKLSSQILVGAENAIYWK